MLSSSLAGWLLNHLIVPLLLWRLTHGLMYRLGPPDFYPPTPNCAEEILNKDTCQIGYKELIDGIEVSDSTDTYEKICCYLIVCIRDSEYVQ